MRVITKKDLIAEQRPVSSGPGWKELTKDTVRQEIAIEDPVWVQGAVLNICEECDQDVDVTVMLGDEGEGWGFGWDQAAVPVCLACLEKAVALAKGAV